MKMFYVLSYLFSVHFFALHEGVRREVRPKTTTEWVRGKHSAFVAEWQSKVIKMLSLAGGHQGMA